MSKGERESIENTLRDHPGIADCAVEGKGFFEPQLIEIIIENTADTAGFLAMFQEEILVTFFFKFRVVAVTKRIDGGFDSAMKMFCIFFKAIVGR